MRLVVLANNRKIITSSKKNVYELEIAAIGDALQSQYPKTIFFTGHCTEEHAFRTLSQILTNHIEQFYCGYSKKL